MGTPKAAMLEQLAWLGKEVLPEFTRRCDARNGQDTPLGGEGHPRAA
jgi:hypothetical protein